MNFTQKDYLLIKAKPLKFQYKNWKGVIADREVLPIDHIYTTSKWHGPEAQWFLQATDIEKGEQRLFAVRDIIKFY